jgi:hypothetical protein
MIARRFFALACLVTSAALTSACSSTHNAGVTPAPANASVRAVHGSPDAGPVDIYVYGQGGTRPSTPTVSAAAYPQITGFLSIPAGTYTVDVIAPAGSPSTTTPVATENVTVTAGTSYSIVVGGSVTAKTLQFVNFIEPAEVAGQTALVVHHASPYVQNALNGPVGVGVYNAAAAAPATIPEVFSFSLASASGPAASGAVSGGEFFLSPLPAGLPAAIGFAAGPPAGGNTLTTLVTATPSQLAAGLKNPTTAETTLAADTSSAVPAGAHISVFAVDTSSAAQLIGTLDP